MVSADMPRSSRHKLHKHGSRDRRDRSDSEEDRGSRDRKQRAEESGSRVSGDLEPERRKLPTSSLLPGGNSDQIAPDGGDFTVEHRKKRKDREEDSAATDRWVGGAEDNSMVDKGTNGKVSGAADLEKSARSKILSVDSEGRSSRRRESSAERYEDIGAKADSSKHRSEKDSSRRESSGQYKDAKERDKEGGAERDKNGRDSRHERSEDTSSRSRGTKTVGSEAEHAVKKDKDNTEWHIQDELRNPELEKELEKRIRRRDGSGDKDKWQGDGKESDERRCRESDERRCRDSDDKRCRENDDRRLSSSDDRTKNGSYRDGRYKDERNRDGRYGRDKYREDLDRDRRHRDDRHRDEHSSREHASGRYDGKHIKDDKFLESRRKKSKLQDSDHDDGSYFEDHGTKFKDITGRKRFSYENEDHRDLKLRNTKQPRGDVEKSASNTSKLDSHTDRVRSEYRHPDKVDSSFSKNRPKSSPSSSSHVVKDQSRCSSKLGESTQRESPSQERFRTSAASTGDHASASGVRDRDSEPRSREKSKPKDHTNSSELLTEISAAPQYDRTPRSDGHVSPIKLTERDPPSASDRQGLNKSGARNSLDIEDTGQISSTPKDGDYSTIDRVRVDNHSQIDMQYSEHIPFGSSSFSRPGHFSGRSPGHLPPAPHVRPRIDSPSVLRSVEDDDRYQTGDRKPNIRYKMNGDYSTGRAQGNAWRSTSPWPPVANGFIPFPHDPQPPGFHSAIQQFPTPSLFGIRPSMDMNPTGVSYHVHEPADRFSSHGRPFGWHNLDDSCSPQLQGWDGSNSVFGDESHVYGRPEWDQSRHLMGNRGWERNAGMWKGQNGNVKMEFPVPQKVLDYTSGALTDDAWARQLGHGSHTEQAHSECVPDEWVGQSGHGSHTDRAPSECVPDERTEIKLSNDTPLAKHAIGTSPKTIHVKTIEPSKRPTDVSAHICCTYLSKLDISLGFTRPELYKQCMTLLGTRDPPDGCSFSKHQCPQSVNEDTKAAPNSSHYILNSLFPKTTDAVFQTVMSVYNRQNKAKRLKVYVSHALPKEVRSPPEASDAEKVKAVICPENSPDASVLENVKAVVYRTPEETSLANANSAMYIEEGDAITDAEADGPGDAKEPLSDLISDAVVFVESSSQECEAIMPECRVNLSRIHNSPGSTH